MRESVKDYLHMIKKGVSNIDKVLEASGNILLDSFNLLSEEKKKIAQERYEACMTCPFMSKNAVEFGIYQTSRTEAHCSLCGCVIEGKVMSFESDCAIREKQLDRQLHGWKAKWYKV